MHYLIFGAREKGRWPKESADQITFFNWLEREHPEYSAVALHVRNEGNKTIEQVMRQKAEGMRTGAADIIICGSPAFVCELKSKNKSAKISEAQESFLNSAHNIGAFACVVYGHAAAKEAFLLWKSTATNMIKSGL